MGGHQTAMSRRAQASSSGNQRWKAMRLAGISVMGRFHVKNVMRISCHPTSRRQCLVSPEPCASAIPLSLGQVIFGLLRDWSLENALCWSARCGANEGRQRTRKDSGPETLAVMTCSALSAHYRWAGFRLNPLINAQRFCRLECCRQKLEG